MTGVTTTPAAQVERTILQERVVAVVRHVRAAEARAIAGSCLAGGLRVIEVTFTTPDADRIIADLVAQGHDGAVIGAGTILRADQVALAIDAGAQFLVSPLMDADILDAGRQAGVLTVPGALTPTEVGAARGLGATVVKLFPASSVGPAFARAIRDVLPDVRLMPTGGIGEPEVEAWLSAGAGAVGVSSLLNRVHAAEGPAAVEALASRLARNATRPRHVDDLVPNRSAP